MKQECYLCKITISTIDPDPEDQQPEGYGSASNSIRADYVARVTETTPLVRFPEFRQSIWSGWTGLIFGCLLAMLLAGTIISVYLLVIQHNSDHVLPPVDTPLMLITRRHWNSEQRYEPPAPGSAPSKHIVVVQTSTVTCNDVNMCIGLLQEMQRKHDGRLPYNFLVSSNGATFEALGWRTRSPMFPHLAALVVAFIGNFTKDTPTTSQLEEAFTLFDASNIEGHLTPDFTIIGKVAPTGEVPTYLFASLQNLTQWDQLLTDEY